MLQGKFHELLRHKFSYEFNKNSGIKESLVSDVRNIKFGLYHLQNIVFVNVIFEKKKHLQH